MSDDEQLIGECAMWLSITSQLFGTRMGKLLEPHGLTTGQFSILNHLANPKHAKGARISDIATAVEVNQPAVTKAIAKFQNMGLVTLIADSEDQRSKRARLTDSAHIRLQEIRQDLGSDLSEMLGEFNMEELQTLNTGLRRLGQWLDTNRL